MKSLSPFSCLLATLAAVSILHAEERTMTPEQMEALEKNGDFTQQQEPRPANLPDLTKGEDPPVTENQPWTLGPTGIIGMWIGGFGGDQFQVQGTLKGSPAEGKILWGDVITGINGRKFATGGHMGIEVGNAIIEAEKEENGGLITFQIWRDRNYAARFGKKNIASVDVDEIFDQARDDNSLYDWKPEEEREKEVRKMGFDEFPLDPVTLDIELKLRVFPAYADTAPYDCPKTEQILEDAWKVLEQRFVADPKNPRSGRGGIIEAIALVASGKPEHRKIVREWVRRPKSIWGPPTTPPGTMFEPEYKGYKGFQSWNHGFNGLNCALYYEATGDDYVLPALRKYAIDTAMGQSALGSWGHTFAFPSFNGGELHRMNPGYGALNAAGNRCFFLIALAKKLGIDHPEIDLAVKRAHRFFGSYVDQGAIPYGDHPAGGTDDSNGKNSGVAFAMNLLGDDYGAKYFAMMSSHCAFTRRGGHAADYHGNWSSWAATLCGPQVRTYNERNLRWRRTLCRMFDGSFVYHSPTGKYTTLRDPTATEVLHQSVIFKQTLITGKDPNEALYPTEREMKQLLASAQPQFNDPWLDQLAGKPWPERSTDEIFDLLDIFFPKARVAVAARLAERYQAGEQDILPRLLALLESDQPRYRDGALSAIGACGQDTVLSNLSKLTPLLQDPEDFVRITAINVISKYTDSGETQKAMLQATIDEPKAIAPNSVRNATQQALFGKDTPLANKPFESGFDEATVWQALEDLLLLDPAGKSFMSSRKGVWTKDTVVRLAGPLTFAAEEEQIADQMFANRAKPAQDLLAKFGYAEALQATAHRLRKKAAIRRDIRPFVGFKRTLMDPDAIEKQPGAFLGFVDEMEIVLTDDPSTQLVKLVNDKKVEVSMMRMYKKITAQGKAPGLPSIADDVRKHFQAELDKAEGTGAKIKLCRAALANPTNSDYFRKIAAMDVLAEILAADALEDLLPYIGSDYWRLREHCQKVAAELVNSGGADMLASIYARAASSPEIAIGILEVFATSGDQAGLAISREAMKHELPSIRMAAVKTNSALGGGKVVPEIIAHLKSATAKEDLRACEDALLAWREDPSQIAEIRDALIASLPDVEIEARKSIYYILSKIGDSESIAALRKASKTDDMAEFDELVFALSYSPSLEADKLMLDLAATDKRIAEAVGTYSARRMVLGPKGFGDITVDRKMDFAEAMLKLTLDRGLIRYLGEVNEARSLRALMYCLEKGVESAAESLISCAEGMENLSPADSKIAAQSLQDVIEYIEVTRLRGGIKAHMDKDDNYTGWKALQARAGKVLLKVHKPEEAPIPEFDPLEFE